MHTVTVCVDDRQKTVSQLPAALRHLLLRRTEEVLLASGSRNAETVMLQASNARVAEFEGLLRINYVLRDRDFRSVSPIPSFRYFEDYSRKDFQPLLDALSVGDFDLAAALTPASLRLCGFRDVKELYCEEEHATSGYAGDFAVTEIPSGLYPVFAREFQRHEAKDCFTNQLKDFYGLVTWAEGSCVRSSYENEDHPFSKTVVKAPYCHEVAKDILSGSRAMQIHLVGSFEAKPVCFQENGKSYVSYSIIDSSLPDLLKDNPMDLRPGIQRKANSLDRLIAGAAKRAADQAPGGERTGREQSSR